MENTEKRPLDNTEKRPLFNAAATFRDRTIDETKTALLGYPEDRDWCERARKHPLIQHHLGRNKFEPERVNTRAFDKQLLERIRRDQDGPEYDEYEAAEAINLLDKTDVLSTTREGAHYVVTMRVAGGVKTVHTLKLASQRAIAEYDAASDKRMFEGRNSQVRFYLEPGGALYDQLEVAHDGYAEGSRVPINHKATAADAVVRAMLAAREADDADPEE